MRSPQQLALTLLAAAGLAVPPSAQEPLPRAVRDPATIVVDPARHATDHVVMKLAEGSAVRIVDSRLESAAGIDLAPLRAALAGRAVAPLFAGLEDALATIRARLRDRVPPAQMPADLALYFRAATASADDARRLLAALHALAVVEVAYPPSRPVPPPGLQPSAAPGDILPVTPSFTGQQGYRGPGPGGVDAFRGEQLTGGLGAGVTVLDLEWGWRFDHEDLAALRPGSRVGPPQSQQTFNDHGLAVVGVLAGDHDAWGVTGLTPDIAMRATSVFPSTGYSVATAIVAGLSALQAQDVLLIEAQASTPFGFGPVEWDQAEFDAIQTATRLGIITVEPAGNGGMDLDDPKFGGLFNSAVRDSGAILVGSSNGFALVRSATSCYGSRVDVNGWGAGVVSAGYGDLFAVAGDPRQSYTRTFGGTSAASAMVAGVVAALVGASRAQLPPALAAANDPAALRTALRTHGTPLPGQRIGRRPDLALLLPALQLERGLDLPAPPRLGQVLAARITPPFAAGVSDAWTLLAAVQPANAPLALGNPDPLCQRLLLDPTSMVVLFGGPFTVSPAVVPVPIPNRPSLVGARFYLQALTLQVSTGSLCTTNGAMGLVAP